MDWKRAAHGLLERRTSNIERRTSNVEPKRTKRERWAVLAVIFASYVRLFCSTLGVRCWMFGVRILFERGVSLSELGENWRSPTWHGRRQFWIGRGLRAEASADAGINPFGVLGLRWRQVSQRRRPLLVLVEKKRHMTEAVMRRCGWGQLENLAVRDFAGCP